MKKLTLLLVTIICSFIAIQAQLSVHHLFQSDMVLQRDKPITVWGWGDAGKTVKLEFAGQSVETLVDADGNWLLELTPLAVCSEGKMFTLTCEEEALIFQNVLVGDVWLLTGQSNMEFDLARIHHGDEEIVSANFPKIRLLTIPANASPDPQTNFEKLNEWDGWYERHDIKGFWLVCSPQTVPTFSGIGYVFGRRIHMASQVPIGLIDVSWGGTTIEGFTSRGQLMKYEGNQGLIDLWDNRIAQDPAKASDRNNPGAAFNGMMKCIEGAALKGIIWHQGYNNALGDSRPKLYTKNLQLMVQEWRQVFNDENLPFGIIELSAGGEGQTLENFTKTMADAGTYIREAQLQAYKDMEHIGFVAAYDEQVNWYHPQKKTELAERMARWALATQYGYDFGWKPALPVSVDIQGNTLVIAFDKEVITPDGRPIEGMALAGKDQKFYPAQADYFVSGKDDKGRDILDRSKVVVTCSKVKKPVACRYAWARNPLGNLVHAALPERVLAVPSFRTDDWDWPEAPFVEGNSEEFKAHRLKLQEIRNR
jgi:sialate O-acetylesterase